MMGIKPQQVERLTQIVVAKPLAWAFYACGMVVVGLARAGVVGLRLLLQKEVAQNKGLEPKERQWPMQS
jgi:hypothetical protein